MKIMVVVPESKLKEIEKIKIEWEALKKLKLRAKHLLLANSLLTLIVHLRVVSIHKLL